MPSTARSSLAEVMNCPPEDLGQFRKQPHYDTLVGQYRNYEYDELHLAREPVSDDHLCDRCRTIDFKAIFSTNDTARGKPVFDLGPVKKHFVDACRFCRILVLKAEAVTSRYPDREVTMWQLELFPGQWIRGSGHGLDKDKSYTNTILGAFPCTFGLISMRLIMDRWILPMVQQDLRDPVLPYQGRPLCHNSVEYTYLSSCLKRCVKEHPRLEESQQSMSERIMVLDCVSKKLVRLPIDCNYTCLSYVWGSDNKPSFVECALLRQTRKLPSNLPRTIRDAVTVVRNLNEKYLWVDRYCIDQCHSESKQMHIDMMSEIYGKAVVTLVGLGSSLTLGLPGVSTLTRLPQYRFLAGDLEYLYMSPKLEHFLQQSKWSTRGWTLQEASLSRHIIYFTPAQAVPLCEAGETPEELSAALPLALRENTVATWSGLDQEMLLPSSELPFSSLNTLERLVSQLRDYQSRDLTYESDALNAFWGILSTAPYKSWWGVPIYHDRCEKVDFTSAAVLKASVADASAGFTHGLLWRSCEESIAACSNIKRRSMFPSWSWASVKRPVCLHSDSLFRSDFSTIENRSYRLSYHPLETLYFAKISLSFPNDREHITLEQFCNHYKETCLPELSRTLFIETYVFRGPWRLLADAAEPDEPGQFQLRKRLEDPSELLKGFHWSARTRPNSHYIAFDAELVDEYKSIVRGQSQLSAILMQGWGKPEAQMLGDVPFPGTYVEVGNAVFHWLAVIFRDGVAKRVGVIRSDINYEYGLNRRSFKYCVCKLD